MIKTPYDKAEKKYRTKRGRKKKKKKVKTTHMNDVSFNQ